MKDFEQLRSEMTPERRQANLEAATRQLDDMQLDMHASLLQEARQKTQSVKLVVIVLTAAAGTDSIVTYYCDYGDGDGVNHAVETVRSMQTLLQPGESIRYHAVNLDPVVWQAIRQI